ncbi:MAG: sigma factor [Aureliella sp.]
MPADQSFRTTRWSLVCSAARQDKAGLEELCQTYWPALYAAVRRMGYSDADAQDLTQAFFTRLLDKQILIQADSRRGRFRSFLLTALHRFVINEWHRGEAAKRGGNRRRVAMDLTALPANAHLSLSQESPEAAYQREWAMCLIEKAFQQLRAEHVEQGRQELFEAITPCIARDQNSPSYASIAEKLGNTIASAKMATTRARKRLRELLLEEIRATVSDENEVEDELIALFLSVTR